MQKFSVVFRFNGALRSVVVKAMDERSARAYVEKNGGEVQRIRLMVVQQPVQNIQSERSETSHDAKLLVSEKTEAQPRMSSTAESSPPEMTREKKSGRLICMVLAVPAIPSLVWPTLTGNPTFLPSIAIIAIIYWGICKPRRLYKTWSDFIHGFRLFWAISSGLYVAFILTTLFDRGIDSFNVPVSIEGQIRWVTRLTGYGILTLLAFSKNRVPQ